MQAILVRSIGLIGAVGLIAVLSFSVAVPAKAAQLTESQIQAILGLLSSFGSDQATINSVNAALRNDPVTPSGVAYPANPVSACQYALKLDRGLGQGASDATSDFTVSALQNFLAFDTSVYPEAKITGYFGPATERAVQAWQTKHGIVSSGSPSTNGFGFVGAKTRAAMQAGCN